MNRSNEKKKDGSLTDQVGLAFSSTVLASENAIEKAELSWGFDRAMCLPGLTSWKVFTR